MATPVVTTPDTSVTLKVNYDGNTRRFKLPLRDLGASSLENKIREQLNIPQGTDCTFERYSDSATSYISLDATNISVYKQLYRAAKAKLKLKLRVTTAQNAKEEKMVPKPVTVEDEPEPLQPASPSAAMPDLIKREEPDTVTKPAVIPTIPAAAVPIAALSPAIVRLGKSIAVAEESHKAMEFKMRALAASVAKLHSFNAPFEQNGSPSRPEQQSPPPFTESVPEPPPYEAAAPAMRTRANFTVCCNSCDKTIPDSHFHCATCDDGDFDLCQDCVDKGITCYGAGHWLIKRAVKNGVIISSTTEKIAPKLKVPTPARQIPVRVAKPEVPAALVDAVPLFSSYAFNGIRTCNCCVQELPEHDFVHCTTCDDFDLCKACFAKDRHGHHPKHAFLVVAPDSVVTAEVVRRLAAGRSQKHNAICDGCDKYIVGVRHKCLDCPDWDYCGECITSANFIHPNHRFVPIYEQIDMRRRAVPVGRSMHVGISCDGPLCTSGLRNGHRYIIGDRFKCAVCHDTDFCANCEASPANTHNKTHPLIKFKTPVRHVSVTTTGERGDGHHMPTMGDRIPRRSATTNSRATETTTSPPAIAATNVLTVVDVKPSQLRATVEEKEIKEEEKEIKKEETVEAPVAALAPTPAAAADDWSAVYVKDTVADGTVMPPDHVFEQTWVLRNSGNVPWPAGCTVKYVGGDYMGHVDPKHPVAIEKLVPAFESTICYSALPPGHSASFTVLLRTPAKEGRSTSYWRLTSKDGIKFGHRLWCDVEVRQPEPVEEKKEEVTSAVSPIAEANKVEDASSKSEGSQMIFPKLEKESPVASVHEDAKSETVSAHKADHEVEYEVDDFENCDHDDEWDDSEDGIMTDEEYDILDASDEEPLDEQQQKLLKK